MTERCSSVVNVASGPPSLHYYCAVVLHSCTVLPPVGHTLNHQYHCCQLTDHRAVVRNVIAPLRFPFHSPSYNNETRSRDNRRRGKAIILHILSAWNSGIQLWGCTRRSNIDISQRFQNNVQYVLVLRRFFLRRFTFTTPVQSDRALPTCGPSLSQLKCPFCTQCASNPFPLYMCFCFLYFSAVLLS